MTIGKNICDKKNIGKKKYGILKTKLCGRNKHKRMCNQHK